MAFSGIEKFKSKNSGLKKIEIMTTAESILIQDVNSQVSDFNSDKMLLIRNGAGKKVMCISNDAVIGIRILNDLTSMV